MLGRILIANRSVGAIRAAKTYRRLGIETVGIYTEPDKRSLHLKYVDRACPVRSYYNIREIVLKAKATQCEAIDPVYGFRTEHPEFPATCEDYGIVFVGPSSKSLSIMGDKLSTSKLVEQSGLQVIPRSEEIPRSESDAARIAEDLGFPVILKPVRGGGGKGTFIARNEEEVKAIFPESVRIAKLTSESPDVYIEKFLENVRHEETQFISDRHGNAVFLGGRSCSLQRRKQKMIEETQSVEIEKRLEPARKKCIDLIRRVGYSSTITFEFLVEKGSEVYFLEANKRLQVEHRPTEMVTRVDRKRIDLVEERLKIAEGKKLDYKQKNVSSEGWAVNCRLYAEDPWSGFRGHAEVVGKYEEPKEDNMVIDSCLYSGYPIPFEYDPLVATITVFGNNRTESIAKMSSTLRKLRLGDTMNLGLLRMILEDEDVKKGDYDTTFVERKIGYYKERRKLEEISERLWYRGSEG